MKNYSVRTFGAQAIITDRVLYGTNVALFQIDRRLRAQIARYAARQHGIVKTQPLIETERDLLYRTTTITASVDCWTRQGRAHHHHR